MNANRREALKQLAAAGAAAVLPGGVFRGWLPQIGVAGTACDVGLFEISPSMLRLIVAPAGRAAVVPDDGALVAEAKGTPIGKAGEWLTAGGMRVGLDRITGELHIQDGSGRVLQRLTFSPSSPVISFLTGRGPLLGLGEGGPQFDRKGTLDRGRNGQGG